MHSFATYSIHYSKSKYVMVDLVSCSWKNGKPIKTKWLMITKIAKGDQFTNIQTGEVWECTEEGLPLIGNKGISYKQGVATFKYVRTDLVAKPSDKVSLATPTKNKARLFTAKWTVPKSVTDAKNKARFQNIEAVWKVFYKFSDKGTESSFTFTHKLAANASSDTFNLDSFKIGKTNYNRNSFFPQGGVFCTKVTVSVYGTNTYKDAGSGNTLAGKGTAAAATYTFKLPRKPTIDAFAFNKTTGVVSTHVKTDAGTDAQERYDTKYSCYVYNSKGAQVAKVADTTGASTDIALSWNAAGYQGLGYDDFYRIRVNAWSRGLVGTSENAGPKDYYVSYPAKVTVSKVSISSKGSDGQCTLAIATNSTAQHPVDRVKLEYLADCDYATAGEIPGTAEWADSGIVDDAKCTALAMSVQDLIPSAGKYSWVRVKSWHANEAVLYRYSEPQRLRALETPAPTAQDESIFVLGANKVDDTTIGVQLGWNASGRDDATGTELSWANSGNAWKSTEDPNRYTFTWSDGAYKKDGVTYQDSAYIYIKNLTQGEPVYIRARRYLETETSTTWSNYSSQRQYIPYQEPDNVVMSVSQYVAKGDSLPVSWSYGSYAAQKDWFVCRSDGIIIMSGSGINTSCEIPADRLESAAVDNVVSMYVEVTSGSGFRQSDTHQVNIVEPPTVEVTASQITAQPWSFGVECSTNAQLQVIVTSQGVTGTPELNIGNQPEGDTLYSTVVTPEWTESGGTHTATIEVPKADYRDNGTYTIEVVATDTKTGLQATATGEATVAWAHQAGLPNCEITTSYEFGEETGDKYVQIALSEPEDAAEGDTYSIYRLTGGNATLIGSELAQDAVVTDMYAPYGDMGRYYRVATVTADGDTSYFDFLYYLQGSAMRFDWDGNSLELPYNLSIADSFTKDVETRQHMDGSTNAYWNSSVARKASLSSDVIRLHQQEQIDLVQQMARYPGAVFVRTPDGSAYQADVQVRDMSTTGAVEAIAIDAFEINTTNQFMLEVAEEEEE